MTLRIDLRQLDLDGADSHSQLLHQATRLAAENDASEVVIHLGDLKTIRSDQLNKLIALNCQLRNEGRAMVLAGVRKQLKEVFQLTRLDRLFEIQCDEVAQA